MADLKISALTASTTPLAGTEVLPIVQSSTTKKVSVANLTDGRNTGVAKLMVNNTGGTPAVGVDIYNQSGRVNAPIPGGTSREWPIWRGSQRYDAAFDKGIVGIYMYSNSGFGQDGGMRLKTSPNDVAEVTAIDIDSAQNVTVSAGNLVIGTSGKGIDFSATSGSGTSELFADYEEGTWTPTLTNLTNNATIASATCSYTKVGRLVTVMGYLETGGLGSVTGTIYIGNLPFANVNSAGGIGAGSIGYAANMSLTAGQSVTLASEPNQTYLPLRVWTATTGTTAMQASQWANNGAVVFTCTYRAT